MKASKPKSKFMQYATVPDKNPYNPNIEKVMLIIAAVILVIMGAIAFGSCTTTKKAYEHIAKNPPETQKDTLNLDKRAKLHYKPEPPKVIPGKPVVKTVITENKERVKSLQKKVDSLVDAISFRDGLLDGMPNVDSLKEAIKQQIMKDCKTETEKEYINTTDTVYLPDYKCESQLSTLDIQYREATNTITNLNSQITDYENKIDSLGWVIGRFFRVLIGQWWFWILLLFGGAAAYLKLKGKIPFI